ncbi:ribosomal protein L24e-domain-containing protein [Lipomyces doorenjongii]|uniref:60S ribosomal protein eL24 n=1 Tax=Lipomyces doorenjongii TaxID=383834 RepID=UPI0034CE8FF8
MFRTQLSTIRFNITISKPSLNLSHRLIYPGRGKLYVRGDSKVFRFVSSKSASLFLQRKNPRRISWTVLYRRMHKKGVTEEVTKKRTRRTVKHQRAIVGASLEGSYLCIVIKEKRSIRPEARKAARSESIALAKEKKKADDAKKKAEKAKLAAAGKTTAAGAKFSKQQMKGAAPKVTARSR